MMTRRVSVRTISTGRFSWPAASGGSATAAQGATSASPPATQAQARSSRRDARARGARSSVILFFRVLALVILGVLGVLVLEPLVHEPLVPVVRGLGRCGGGGARRDDGHGLGLLGLGLAVDRHRLLDRAGPGLPPFARGIGP